MKGKAARALRSLLALLAITCLVAGAAYIARGAGEEAMYREVRDSVVSSEVSGDIDWDSLRMTNPDIAGWLTVEGTPIDYPVTYGKMKPDGFYLDHDFWGNRSSAGCPYVDRRSSANGDHVLIYAHRMGWSSRMFGSLWDRYRQVSFNELGYALWSTPDAGAIEFRPLCAMRVPESYATVQMFSFTDEGEFSGWLAKLVTDADARSEDWESILDSASRVLTLVTCSQAWQGSTERTLVIFAAP